MALPAGQGWSDDIGGGGSSCTLKLSMWLFECVEYDIILPLQLSTKLAFLHPVSLSCLLLPLMFFWQVDIFN